MIARSKVRRLAWIVWAVLVTLAVGRAGLYHLPRHQGCYSVFADGGRHWLNGQDLYDTEYPDNLVDVFRYSPLTAVTLVPLAWVPDPLGSALLRAVSVGVFLLGLGWWARTFVVPALAGAPPQPPKGGTTNKDSFVVPALAGAPPQPPKGGTTNKYPFVVPALAGEPPQPLERGTTNLAALLFLLCAPMVSSTMMDVQLNLLTIGFLLLTMAAAARERWNTAALAASLAVCLKAYPMSLALVLAVVFPRRFAGRWLGMMLLCLALPFLVQSPEYVLRQYIDWVQWGLNQRRMDTPHGGFQDLMRFCRCWLVPINRETYFWLEVGSGAAIALVCWLCRRLPRQELLHCIFGMCCAWMMALGPSTEATTYVQLAPAVAGAVLIVWTEPARRWYRTAVTVAFVILVLSQAQLLLPLERPLHRLAAQPFAALLFLVAVAVHALSRRPLVFEEDRADIRVWEKAHSRLAASVRAL